MSFLGVENAATSSGEGLAAQRKEANTMETVRDFVEKIVVGLIGNLDDTPIHRLYDHPSCKLKSECANSFASSFTLHSKVNYHRVTTNSFFFFFFLNREQIEKRNGEAKLRINIFVR